MKTSIKTYVLIQAAMIILVGIAVASCSDNGDNPLPKPDPQQPSQPKEWGDETPFFLIDSVESLSINCPKTEDGFFYNTNHNCDYFVINHNRVMAPGHAAPESSYIYFSLSFGGLHVSPVENEERYNQMCRKMGAKPICTLNDSAALADLPFYRLRNNHTMETVVKVEVLTDRNPKTGEAYQTPTLDPYRMIFQPTASKFYIDKYLNVEHPEATPLVGVPIKYITIPAGSDKDPQLKQYLTWFDVHWRAIIEMPDAEGTYTYTIKAHLTNGKVLEDSIKVKFLPEGTQYPQ